MGWVKFLVPRFPTDQTRLGDFKGASKQMLVSKVASKIRYLFDQAGGKGCDTQLIRKLSKQTADLFQTV